MFSRFNLSPKNINKFLFILIISMLLMVIFQLYFFGKGIYFGFPINYFITNADTLELAENAFSNNTLYRVTTYFGEPSYTAFVVISLLSIFIMSNKNFDNVFLFFIFCVLVIILSKTLVGSISLFIILYLYFHLDLSGRVKLLFNSFPYLILSILIFFSFYDSNSNYFYSRIYDVLHFSDESTYERIALPIKILVEKALYNDYIFGIAGSEKFVIHNAILGILIHYGVFSILLLLIIWDIVKKHCFQPVFVLIYLLLCMFYNGAFFAFDKSIIMSLVIGASIWRKKIDDTMFVG
jgi:hypothetical protein